MYTKKECEQVEKYLQKEAFSKSYSKDAERLRKRPVQDFITFREKCN